jgi:hypothetical protein
MGRTVLPFTVCFGFLGYRNARFGRIEAHEATTAWGREKLLSAKEIAERITEETGMPIAAVGFLDGNETPDFPRYEEMLREAWEDLLNVGQLRMLIHIK